MASDNPLGQTRSLFARLGQIQRLLRQAERDNEPSLWADALELVDKCTYNARWYDEIASHCEAHFHDLHDLRSRFLSQSIAEADMSSQVRIETARESGDPLILGNMFVRYGLYRDALMAYNSSVHRLECISNLNILQGNWSIVQANLGKNLSGLSNVHLLNLATAYWFSCQFGDALAVVLRLDPESDLTSAWLSEPEILSMLMVSAMITLDRKTLKYFSRMDPVFMFLNRNVGSRLVEALLQVEVALFWSEMAKLEVPECNNDFPANDQPEVLLRDRIQKDWLFVHNKLPLSTVLEIFQEGRKSEYTFVDLLEDLRRWQAPYRINTLLGIVEAYEPVVDNGTAAEELVRWFKRDALLLCHQKQKRENYYTSTLI